MANLNENKKIIFLSIAVVGLIILAAILFLFSQLNLQNQPELPPIEEPQEIIDQNDLTQNPPITEEQVSYQYELRYFEQEGESYFSLSEFSELFAAEWTWDSVNRVGTLSLYGQQFTFIAGVPVLEHDGIALPIEWLFLAVEDTEVDWQKYGLSEGIYFPLYFLTDVLQLTDLELNQEEGQVLFNLATEEEAFAHIKQDLQFDLADLNRDELIEYLSFLGNPIPGSKISTRDSHLPGAPRTYRNGYHEGIDWYSGTSGIRISIDTPIRSMADGVVVRVDHDYVEMTHAERRGFLELAHQLQDTPVFILDKLRGRSVWVQHDHGVLVRYAHLFNTEESIRVGQRVEKGDILGYVGNSGTSFALDGDLYGGLHLHADLLIYGELFWKHLPSSADVRYVLENIFQD